MDKKYLEKIGDIDKKIAEISGLVTTTGLNTKNREVNSKIPVDSGLMTTAVIDTKIKEVKNKIPHIVVQSAKEIMMLNYQKSRENTLLLPS